MDPNIWPQFGLHWRWEKFNKIRYLQVWHCVIMYIVVWDLNWSVLKFWFEENGDTNTNRFWWMDNKKVYRGLRKWEMIEQGNAWFTTDKRVCGCSGLVITWNCPDSWPMKWHIFAEERKRAVTEINYQLAIGIPLRLHKVFFTSLGCTESHDNMKCWWCH